MTAVLPSVFNGSVITRQDQMRFELPDGRTILITAKMLSPEEAQQLLTLNTRNRAINSKSVDSMAADIVEGEWHFTGDTIKIAIDKHGTRFLADAQHRLRAIVKSGFAVPVLLVENLDPDVTDVIDQGRPRKVGDILKLTYGHSDIKNDTILSGIASMLITGYEGILHPSRRRIAEYAHQNIDKLQAWTCWAVSTARETDKVAFPGRRMGGSAMAASPLGTLAIWMTDRGASYEMVTDFFWRIATGLISDEDESNVIPALRKRQKNGIPLNRIQGGGSSVPMLFGEFSVYINAYNRWVTGDAVSMIKSQKQQVNNFSQLPKVSTASRTVTSMTPTSPPKC